MFTQLMESKPGSTRGSTGTAVSFVAHYGLILAVLYTSAEARIVDGGPKQETIRFIEPEQVEPAPKQDPPPELIAAPQPVKLASALVAPVEIPNVLPDIDLSRAPTDPSQFTGRGGLEPTPGGERVADPGPRPDNTYLDSEVDKPVTQAPNSAAPAYPDILRQAGVEGDALVSFVVDTTGRVDVTTFKVIRASHDLFATAVRNALPRMRFIPAETSRGKVRQVVQQPFSFAIIK